MSQNHEGGESPRTEERVEEEEVESPQEEMESSESTSERETSKESSEGAGSFERLVDEEKDNKHKENHHKKHTKEPTNKNIDDGSDEVHHLFGEEYHYETAWPYHKFSLWMLFGRFAHNIDSAPRTVVYAMTIMSWNAIGMALAEILIEILMVAGGIPKIEFRGGFLVLTLLSALLAVHTFADLIDNDLDTTVQVMRISLVVEVGLVLSDLEFILNPEDDPQWLRAAYRAPFMGLTFLNVILVLYAVGRLRIEREVFGTPYLFSCVPYCRKTRKKIRREERGRKFEERIIRGERRSREMMRRSMDLERGGSVEYNIRLSAELARGGSSGK